MCLSMTGFASTEIALRPEDAKQTIHLAIEIKTLNSRFFEVTCKLPPALGSFEGRVISLLRKSIMRGRAFLIVKFTDSSAALEKLVVAHSLASEYVKESKKIGEELGISGELGVPQLLQLPHVLSFERMGLEKSDESAFFDGIKKSIEVLVATRRDEGDFLKLDLLTGLANCKQLMEKVSSRNVVMVRDCKKQVSEISAKVQSGESSAQAQLDEMAHHLDKIDVHEEISRFNAHAASAKQLIESAIDEKGKKLDFISQELLRETNTLAAKCSDYEVASLAVDIKVELEKVREQAQNVV